VSVGVDHDTGAFAVNAIRSWWTQMGRARYPNAKSLLITAEGGGSNGSRLRLWKVELTARPSSGTTKSCTRTSSGEPFSRHSRPPFLKSPTSYTCGR